MCVQSKQEMRLERGEECHLLYLLNYLVIFKLNGIKSFKFLHF